MNVFSSRCRDKTFPKELLLTNNFIWFLSFFRLPRSRRNIKVSCPLKKGLRRIYQNWQSKEKCSVLNLILKKPNRIRYQLNPRITNSYHRLNPGILLYPNVWVPQTSSQMTERKNIYTFFVNVH